MTQQDIVDALNARLQAFAWPADDIAWEGLLFRPALPKPYLSVRLSSYVAQAIGSGVAAAVQHDGTLTVVAFTASDAGRAQAGAIAGRLAKHFGRGTVLQAGGVPVVLMQAGEQPGYASGDWYAVPVVVTFTALELPTASP